MRRCAEQALTVGPDDVVPPRVHTVRPLARTAGGRAVASQNEVAAVTGTDTAMAPV